MEGSVGFGFYVLLLDGGEEGLRFFCFVSGPQLGTGELYCLMKVSTYTHRHTHTYTHTHTDIHTLTYTHIHTYAHIF